MATLAFLHAGAVMAAEQVSYENKKTGLKFSYPANWVADEKVPGIAVAFGAPKDKANLDLVENVTVIIQDLTPERSTLERYTKAYEKELKSEPSAKVVESTKTTLAGLPAHMIVCVGKQGTFDIRFMQVWTVKDGKAYLLTYGAPKSTYENFLAEAESIISSLRFI